MAPLYPSPAILARKFSRGRWKRTRHLDYLSGLLRDRLLEGDARLVVEVPPRCGKSTLISWYGLVWFLEWRPEASIILASATASLAERWSRRVRNTIEENPRRLSVRIAPDSKAVDRWATTQGGEFLAIGVGGNPTGSGGDLVVVDDPLRGVDANSDTARENLWTWWTDVLRSRLEPGASAIILHQRWHEADLAGRVLAHDEDRWERITLRALAEKDDPLDRRPGRALWPARYDERALAEIRRDIGSLAFEAQYQQRPSPPSGSIFRRDYFRYFREVEAAYVLRRPDGSEKAVPKAKCWTAQTCDTALRTTSANDWTCVLTFAVTPGHDLLFLGVARERLEVPQQWGFLLRQRAAHPGLRFQAVEAAQSGIGLLQQGRLEGMPLRELKADVDKVTRATRLAVSYENGMVYHRADAPWLAAFEDEVLRFPVGRHDDQVDVASYAALEAGEPLPGLYIFGPNGEVWSSLDYLDEDDEEAPSPTHREMSLDEIHRHPSWRPLGRL